ncbi:hypothetical protein BD770DRAFT_436717 [Pilaira anomala]|nr:hypothetical protein BD770DRAFT_436717 [Pilaira anomala]
MLNLIEDRVNINSIFENYLTETKVQDWKYERAIFQLVEIGFDCTAETADLQELGSLYKSAIINLKDKDCRVYSNDDKEKITRVTENMDLLSSAHPIKKILIENRYMNEYRYSLQIKAIDAELALLKKNCDSLSAVIGKFAHLEEYYDQDGILDFQKTVLPRSIRKLKEEAHFLVTPKEREMLIEISECNNVSEAHNLLDDKWQCVKNWPPHCSYIKSALVLGSQLWEGKSLSNKRHGEDWYRAHIYANIWDEVFLNDEKLETNRSKCISQMMKTLKKTENDIKQQRLDFILRDLNSDNNAVTDEEKRSVAGVKAYVVKDGLLKKHVLSLWAEQVNSNVLMKQLEAISYQWKGTKLTIYGSRLLSFDRVLTYQKGSFSFPTSDNCILEFSKLLLAIISLKRVVKLNYAKFALILKELCKQKVKKASFSDVEISLATHKSEEEEYNEEFVRNTKAMLDKINHNEKDLMQFSDWEDMLSFESAKRRRTN